MANYQTPGVYVEEISTLPPSVAPVATAIPAFIGHTEKGKGKVERISNLLDYRTLFGDEYKSTFNVMTHFDPDTGQYVTDSIQRKDGDDETEKQVFPVEGADTDPPKYHLFYSVAHFFDNGGGKCYIVSAGDYESENAPTAKQLSDALDKLRQEDEPTLLVLADAVALGPSDYYNLCEATLDQCRDMQDRFGVFDVKAAGNGAKDAADELRNELSHDHLKYGAAYYPYLHTSLNYRIDDDGEDKVQVSVTGVRRVILANGIIVSHPRQGGEAPRVEITAGTGAEPVDFNVTGEKLTISIVDTKNGEQVAQAWTTWAATNNAAGFQITQVGDGTDTIPLTTDPNDLPLNGASYTNYKLDEIKATKTALYNHVKKALTTPRVILPPSAAMVGIYARVDRDRGVWKAPANVSVAAISAPVVKITHKDQEELNVDTNDGKSINAIRTFAGKGTLVWGARTLAGNDNEWRYVPVRRLFIMIEESAKKATAFAVFEPNDATTWLKVKGMIEAFLYGLWEKGALQGSSPDHAYFVNVGLGKTMTAQDILEGRLIVEIGIAAVRPAEFIVLRFMHKLVEG